VRKSSGYGAYDQYINGRKISLDIHRYVCGQAHGEPPAGAQTAHKCGNKLCINPNHLRWSDALGNMADAKAHGTLRGGGRFRQRLFEQEIADICSSPDSLVVLAAKYGSDPAYIGRLRRQYRAAA
jgi:hypothetical protein